MDEENNNQQNNTPSAAPDVMPTGGSNFGQAAKQKAKNTAKKGWKNFKQAVGRAIRAIWKLLPIQVKIVVIVMLFIFIIAASLLLTGMVAESSSVANANISNYISGAKDLDEEAKSLYDEKSSLIKIKLKDINGIYDTFVEDKKGGTETQTLMKYKIGENDVASDNSESRIVDVNDKLPLYKHILLTEKYNFNSIKWYKYAHSTSSLAKKVEIFKEDRELGLKYPDDSKNEADGNNPNPTNLDKFIDLTLPYLQTWYIPLAMSNASVVNGKETDNSRAPAFSYNIIKEAYSNIIVNWYELKKHTTVTKYWTYDEVKKHDVIYGVEVVERVYENGDKSYSLRTSGVSPATFEDSRLPKDTSTSNGLISGKKDPMKEDLVSQNDEYTSHYYVKKAEVFDAKIINEFNYQVYSDADAKKRINADSTSETTATWAKSADNVQNMSRFAMNEIAIDSNGNLSVGGANYSVTDNGSYTENDPSNTAKTVNVYRKNIVLGQYIDYENGIEHTVTRIWKDKLSQSGSETSDYTIDDLLKYNQSEDRKEQVTGMDLCGKSYTSSTSSSGTSTGTSKPTTEIKIGEYTYPVFDQRSYGQTKHGGDTIARAGCGLVSLTTVVGSITGRKVDPVSCGNDTNWTGPKTLEQIAADLKNVYGIDAQATRWNNKNVGPPVSDKTKMTKIRITEALNNNNPVIVLIKEPCPELGCTVAHYITLVGMRDGKAVIANSAGGLEQEYSLDYIIPKMYNQANVSECGFVIANRNGSSSSSTSLSAATTSSTNSGKSEDLKGSYTISKNGYDTIHKSRVTGRSFKLYLQGSSAPWAGDAYQGGETMAAAGCGITSDAILCTGYGHDVTPRKINQSYNGYHVGQELEKAINGGVVSKDWTSFSVNKAIKHMQDGGTFIAHTYSQPYTSREHYMAVIDIDEKGEKIYVADPAGNFTGWQNTEEFFNKMDRLTPYGKDGGTGSYDGTSVENDESLNSSSTVCTGTDSGRYYTSLKNTDGLNRIDFMNSNPDIFHRYIREGAEYYKYVGYSRAKLKLSYWNLKNLFNEVYEKNDGSLPWAYGKTLGFDNIYSSNASPNNTAGGGAGIFTWPVPEYVEARIPMKDQLSADFSGNDSVHNGNHSGVDITHTINSSADIVAAAEGTVIVAENLTNGSTYPNGPRTYGNYVIIDHGNGYFTCYGHMQYNSITVKVGDKVNKGQKIGVMGTTGYSTGNHLHFEIRQGDSWNLGTPIDPSTFFNDDCSSIGGIGNGEFLFTSGYTPDSDYKGQTYSLTSEERSELLWIIYNEYGSGGYEAMVLQAQCLRDALVSKYNNCTPMNIKDSMGYAYGEYGNSKSVTDNSEEAKKALEYVFDQGGSAVQHRIMLMCTDDYYNSGGWHYQASTGNGSPKTIEKVYKYGTVLYFDVL